MTWSRVLAYASKVPGCTAYHLHELCRGTRLPVPIMEDLEDAHAVKGSRDGFARCVGMIVGLRLEARMGRLALVADCHGEEPPADVAVLFSWTQTVEEEFAGTARRFGDGLTVAWFGEPNEALTGPQPDPQRIV